MLDFLQIEYKKSLNKEKGIVTTIIPHFSVIRSKDIMIRGNDFYAIWDEENNVWSTDYFRAIEIIDNDIYERTKNVEGNHIVREYLKTTNSSVREFRTFCKELMGNVYHELDKKMIFANQELKKDMYATGKLEYSLEESDTPAYDELIGTLYADSEREKFEWAIGSIINGDSQWIQKFVIFVGDAGTGKSTVMKIIRMLLGGNVNSHDEEDDKDNGQKYFCTFDAKALGNPSNSFALEPLRNNPLVAIQDDANLSHIEDNTRFNSLVSHEPLIINEKRKTQYEMKFRSFIFLGSNNEVRITDARSGLLRRMIDIAPTGNKVETMRYFELFNAIKFELGGIAYKCLKFYESNKRKYDGYFPINMIRATNHFYNFIEENYIELLRGEDQVTLKDAWNAYKLYCDMSSVAYPYSMQAFKNEFKNYFCQFISDGKDEDGNHIRSMFKGFKYSKVGVTSTTDLVKDEGQEWLIFGEEGENVFDVLGAAFPAQYAHPVSGTPVKAWANNDKKLKDLNTKLLHYVKVPENYIMIDFDIKDPVTGEKSFELNYEAAKVWPRTYAELSKSGAGIHLIYIYDGDINELAPEYGEDIEIKVFKGGASMRRMLSKYCNLPIATINSGLPKKEKGAKMVDDFVLKNEKAIRTMIEKNLRKEYHPGTKPSVDYIYKILNDAWESGIQYDVTDLRPKILAFANNSSNHAEYCVKLVSEMKFMSEFDTSNGDRVERNVDYETAEIAFYDVEVFPNLFVVVYKHPGKDCKIMINPEPEDIMQLVKFRLVGFNCRRYDNHILYARMQGYSNKELYDLSQRIVSDSKNCMFSNAYNLSYTDVYDFSSAGNKKSLKKWEIELGIHHLELGLPWDEPVPEKLWQKVGEYCCNDVISTEAVFNHLQSDWIARQILADLSGLTYNDTTNQHTTKIIFGQQKHPQSAFMYRDLSKPVKWLPDGMKKFLWDRFPKMMAYWEERGDSLLPYFPGYTFERGKSIYKDIEVGEGGYVEADPGMYGYVGLLDVASMHPHSVLTEYLFGEFTQNFADLVDGRILIKHEDWEQLDYILDGKLKPYVAKAINGEITSKQLANALKTAINSVYGLTSAKFENPFRDNRNIDNIVAKRGALFMIELASEVKKRGWKVAHIKTDSIKIPNITQEIVDFVTDFGEKYGYSFEWEATYDKMCLVNDAVYIARYRESDGSVGKWTATGAQFAEPYVFKTLFSHEDLTFDDFCQTKSVSTSLYLDMNENLGKDEHNYVFVGKVGSFCPIKAGCGGGDLCREKDGKYYSATGAKGFKWLEAETVKNMEMQDDIDILYFEKMADNAVATCEEFGSFEWLVDPAPFNCEVPYPSLPEDTMYKMLDEPEEETLPWDTSVIIK